MVSVNSKESWKCFQRISSCYVVYVTTVPTGPYDLFYGCLCVFVFIFSPWCNHLCLFSFQRRGGVALILLDNTWRCSVVLLESSSFLFLFTIFHFVVINVSTGIFSLDQYIIILAGQTVLRLSHLFASDTDPQSCKAFLLQSLIEHVLYTVKLSHLVGFN